MKTNEYKFTVTVSGPVLTEAEAIEMLAAYGLDCNEAGSYHAPHTLFGRVVYVQTELA